MADALPRRQWAQGRTRPLRVHVHYCLATSALSLRTNENEETEGVVGISAVGEDHLTALIW